MIQFSLQKKLHAENAIVRLNVDCIIQDREFVSLYGRSGAGKTSILRMLSGLMKPDKGFVKVNDEIWFDEKESINKKPQYRKVGIVFQDYALFPNMNVRENIAFALPKNDSKDFVDEVLELTELTSFANRKIQTLSGGQSQRVALARAIAKKPSLLLLDEPLSAIDVSMRQQLQTTLLEVHKRFGLTTILVSHDMEEILRLSDRIIFLNNGVIEEFVEPEKFFLKNYNPASLTATILSAHQNELVLLIEDRIIKTGIDNSQNLQQGDKIELVFNNAVPLIRKL